MAPPDAGDTERNSSDALWVRLMQTFRAYLLNDKGKIVWGDWIEAESEEEAIAIAHTLCTEGAPMVELWQGARPVAEIPCGDTAPA